MSETLPVVVVGAGVGGLTAALSLARRGHDVVVVERSERLSEVGAGIQLSPNASGILMNLGLGDALAATGVEPDGIEIRSGVDGSMIAALPLAASARERWGAPFFVVHRGDLQAALLSAIAAEPRISLHLGARLERVREGEGAVDVDAEAGAQRLTIRAEALIGADGVRSEVRTRILAGPPEHYSGRTAWRATFPIAAWTGDFDIAGSTGLWLGARGHLVHYPIRAGREVNVVAIIEDDWRDARWDVPGDAAELMLAFRDWPASAISLLRHPAGWRKWALSSVESKTGWAEGRVALLGDAAHAMLPFVAQGGAMAIEDAAVLARLLASGEGSTAARLEHYARLRRPRVEAVAAAARRNGTVYHLRGPAAAARNLAMRTLGSARLIDRMDWIYGWRDGT